MPKGKVPVGSAQDSVPAAITPAKSGARAQQEQLMAGESPIPKSRTPGQGVLEQHELPFPGEHPIPKSEPKGPPALVVDDQPVNVDELLKPSRGKYCYSSEECKVVVDNCSGKCSCISVHSYAPKKVCKDGPVCPDSFCQGVFAWCTSTGRDWGGECYSGVLGLVSR